MSEQNKKKSAKPVFSLIVLIVLLAIVFYAAPRMQHWIAGMRSEPSSEPTTEETKTSHRASQAQCPEPLRPWLPLVESQIPRSVDIHYRLLHLRVSQDQAKLLLDLEKSQAGKSERFDLILTRDEFGRYLSNHPDLPMKIYPPASSGAGLSTEGIDRK